MRKLLRRLKKNSSWVRIITKSNHSYNGQITFIGDKEIELEFVYNSLPKKSMNLTLIISEIESIERLSCENSTVWT